MKSSTLNITITSSDEGHGLAMDGGIYGSKADMIGLVANIACVLGLDPLDMFLVAVHMKDLPAGDGTVITIPEHPEEEEE